MVDVALLPAHELARRLRRREISSLELLDHYLARASPCSG
jgi:Asp-tRNA(Asn)/Glu-tRNA(Gln) amidotransferase A subunit family amidase